MNQYFGVGEQVGLISIQHPEYNGDAVVLGVQDGSAFQCDLCRKSYRELKGSLSISYKLNIEVQGMCSGCTLWHQSTLRKKTEGNVDFDRMMYQLKEEKVGI